MAEVEAVMEVAPTTSTATQEVAAMEAEEDTVVDKVVTE